MEFRSAAAGILFLLLLSFLQTCSGSRLTEKTELPSSFCGAVSVLKHSKHSTSPQLPKSTGEKAKPWILPAVNTCRQLEAH